jgi:hypothetical protein
MLRMLAWSFEFDSAGVEAQLKKFLHRGDRFYATGAVAAG